MFSYDNFEIATNKGADQTARMGRLVCAFVVRKPLKTGFLRSRPICDVEVVALFMQAGKALVRLCICADSSDHPKSY